MALLTCETLQIRKLKREVPKVSKSEWQLSQDRVQPSPAYSLSIGMARSWPHFDGDRGTVAVALQCRGHRDQDGAAPAGHSCGNKPPTAGSEKEEHHHPYAREEQRHAS
jgi:hypothetical protein